MSRNGLDRTIFVAAVRASETYGQMTDGEWLDHAPEMFLQTEVAREIWRSTKLKVFIDTSSNRVGKALGKKRRGRKPKNSNHRFDITVFSKTDGRLQAVVEVKTRGTHTVKSITKDAGRIEAHFRSDGHANAGYLLVYSVADGNKRRGHLENWFKKTWPKALGKGWSRARSHIVTDPPDNTENGKVWAWGIALFRYDPAASGARAAVAHRALSGRLKRQDKAA